MSHGGDFVNEEYELSRVEYEATRLIRLRADKEGAVRRLVTAMHEVALKETDLRAAQRQLTYANDRLNVAEAEFRLACGAPAKRESK